MRLTGRYPVTFHRALAIVPEQRTQAREFPRRASKGLHKERPSILGQREMRSVSHLTSPRTGQVAVICPSVVIVVLFVSADG